MPTPSPPPRPPSLSSAARPADACVIWLHGDEESGKAWQRLESDVMYGLGTRLPWVTWAFPDAKGGKWFDYELPVLEPSTEFARMDEAVRTVHGMLTQIEDGGIPASRILLGGFGPGAALALLAARTYPRTLAGAACLAGWYLRPRVASSEAGLRTPVLACHGEDDDDVPFELYTDACARLRRDGVSLSCFGYAGMGHRACAEQQTVLAAPKNFITDKLRTLTPAAPRPAGAPRPPASCGAEADVPQCKLDAAEHKAVEEFAEALSRLPDEQFAQHESRHLATSLLDAADAAQREATACRLVSLDETADGGVHVVLAVDGVSSLADADLHVGAEQLELQLPGAKKPFVLRFPFAVDADVGAEHAKFVRKTGQLKLTLRRRGGA